MTQSCHVERIATAVLRELRNPQLDDSLGDDLINAVVDAMVQANVDLDTVTLDEMKCLLRGVLRPALGRERPSRSRSLVAI